MKTCDERCEWTNSSSVSLQVHHMNLLPRLLPDHRRHRRLVSSSSFKLRCDVKDFGLILLDWIFFLRMFILKKLFKKTKMAESSSGLSSICFVRRRQICLLTSVLLIFPPISCTDQHFTRHKSTALSLDETNPQNCRRFCFGFCFFVFFFWLISGDKEEECWSFFFWRLANFFFENYSLWFFEKASHKPTNLLFFILNLKNCQNSLPSSFAQSLKLRPSPRREEEEEEEETEHVFKFFDFVFIFQAVLWIVRAVILSLFCRAYVG